MNLCLNFRLNIEKKNFSAACKSSLPFTLAVNGSSSSWKKANSIRWFLLCKRRTKIQSTKIAALKSSVIQFGAQERKNFYFENCDKFLFTSGFEAIATTIRFISFKFKTNCVNLWRLPHSNNYQYWKIVFHCDLI